MRNINSNLIMHNCGITSSEYSLVVWFIKVPCAQQFILCKFHAQFKMPRSADRWRQKAFFAWATNSVWAYCGTFYQTFAISCPLLWTNLRKTTRAVERWSQLSQSEWRSWGKDKFLSCSVYSDCFHLKSRWIWNKVIFFSRENNCEALTILQLPFHFFMQRWDLQW